MSASGYNPPGLWWRKAVVKAGGDPTPRRKALGEAPGITAELRLRRAIARAECEQARALLKARMITEVRSA